MMLLVIPLCFAEQQSLGVFKKNECVNLIQICANCSYVNFTSVLYPDSTTALGNVVATKTDTIYNYTFCNTSLSGGYIVNGVGDPEGTKTIFAYDFEINTEGNTYSNMTILVILLLLFYSFILFGILKQDIPFTMIGSMGIILMNLYVALNGFMEFDNYLIQGFVLINIAVAGYVLLRTGIEWITSMEHS